MIGGGISALSILYGAITINREGANPSRSTHKLKGPRDHPDEDVVRLSTNDALSRVPSLTFD